MKSCRYSVLLFCLFLVLSPYSINGQNTEDGTTNSVVVIYQNGDVSHLQINQDGVYRVWTKSSEIQYTLSEIVDLDQDGQMEVILISPNDGLLLLDLRTGDRLWKYPFVFGDYVLADYSIGDVTNDGKLEIVIARTSSYLDIVNTEIFTNDGRHLASIPSIVPNDYPKKGSDNVEISDIDQDGLNELIISYGSTMWNHNTNQGMYTIERWNWYDNEFNLYFRQSGNDTGGNTRLMVLPSRIITVGWYNNPIRAFNSEGEEVWNHKMFDIDTKIELAEPELQYVTDEKGDPHLLIFSQNYWTNYSMIWIDLNPITGELQHGPKTIGNTSNIRTTSYENEIIYSALKMINDQNLETSYFLTSQLHVESDEITEHQISNDYSRIQYIGRDNFRLHLVILNHKPYVIAMNDDNQLLINSDNEKIELSIRLDFVRSLSTSHNVSLFSDTEIIQSFQKYSTLEIMGLVFGLSLVLLGLLYFGNIYYQDFKLDNYYGKKWREHFKLKIDKMIQSIIRTNSTYQLPSSFTQSLLLSQTEDENIEPDIPPENHDNLARKFKLKFYNDNTTIFELLNIRTDVAKDLKIGDMAILIEILAQYPEHTEIQNIIPKFKFSTRGTIYKRIDKLENLELIENISVELWPNNIGQKVVKLTDMGIQLLAILYSSLTEDE